MKKILIMLSITSMVLVTTPLSPASRSGGNRRTMTAYHTKEKKLRQLKKKLSFLNEDKKLTEEQRHQLLLLPEITDKIAWLQEEIKQAKYKFILPTKWGVDPEEKLAAEEIKPKAAAALEPASPAAAPTPSGPLKPDPFTTQLENWRPKPATAPAPASPAAAPTPSGSLEPDPFTTRLKNWRPKPATAPASPTAAPTPLENWQPKPVMAPLPSRPTRLPTILESTEEE